MKTIAQLNARSSVLASRSSKVAEDIHLHMVDIVEHFKAHGDATAATILHNVVHSAIRKNAIKNWFEAFGGMKYVAESKKDGKVKPEHFIRNKAVPFEQIDLEVAFENTPWDFTPEPKFKAFDLEAAIKAAIKKAEKALEDTEHAGEHSVPASKLEVLRSLV